jgi:hypothetical protein
MSKTASEAEEDAADIATYDACKAALDAGLDEALPAEVSASILRGDSLLKALRKWKGLRRARQYRQGPWNERHSRGDRPVPHGAL